MLTFKRFFGFYIVLSREEMFTSNSYEDAICYIKKYNEKIFQKGRTK